MKHFRNVTSDRTQSVRAHVGPRADLVRAALEGVAFSIRQGMESFDAAPESISLIGAGCGEPGMGKLA